MAWDYRVLYLLSCFLKFGIITLPPCAHNDPYMMMSLRAPHIWYCLLVIQCICNP